LRQEEPYASPLIESGSGNTQKLRTVLQNIHPAGRASGVDSEIQKPAVAEKDIARRILLISYPRITQ